MLHTERRLGLVQSVVKTVVITLPVPGTQRIDMNRGDSNVAMRVLGIAMDGKDRLVSAPVSAIKDVFRRTDELLVGDGLAFVFVKRDDVMLHRLLDLWLRSHHGFHIALQRDQMA